MVNLRLFQCVELPIPNGSTLTRFFFQDQPQLRNAFIQGIQFYTPTVITGTPMTGSTAMTLADMKKASLVLYSGDLQVVLNIPILALNNINDFTSPFVFNMQAIDNITISWVKSYIQFTSAVTTTNVALAMGVYYTLPR
jgi:hypothetical protein